MRILGIETSCDETAAAVSNAWHEIASSEIYSQVEQHKPYGGVVPEIASRDHVRKLPSIIKRALTKAECAYSDIDALAVTYGPGLASSLLVGFTTAKALSLRIERPLIGVNHLEAHICSLFLGEDVVTPAELCPLLVLLVSGGHTFLIRVEHPGHYQVLGKTYDDAAGEALDKGANLLNLGYPGGPAIENAASGGDPKFIHFPRGLGGKGPANLPAHLDRKLCFSFSGVKTSLLYYLKKNPLQSDEHLRNLAASYQEAVCDALAKRVEGALTSGDFKTFACVGGVAKNKLLRSKLDTLSARLGVGLKLTPMKFCTDNAAMIASTAALRHESGKAYFDPLDIDPNLRVLSW